MRSWTKIVADDRAKLNYIIHNLRRGLVNAHEVDFLHLFVDEALNAKHRTGYADWNGDPIYEPMEEL
jgi:hypothetical protein